MSTFAFVFLKGSVIRATFSLNIVALQVETLSCVLPGAWPTCLAAKFAESCTYDWSVFCKQRWRLLNSFFIGSERLPLSVWAFCSDERIKGLENEIEKFTCDIGFPGEGRFSLVN